MRRLFWGTAFVRAYKRALRKRPELDATMERVLEMLVEDPFQPVLETHKLRGRLSGSWACSVGYDLRIVFDFGSGGDRGKADILLIDLGSHDEVY